MRKIDENTCIYPQWEDKRNVKGGYWSFKISKDKLRWKIEEILKSNIGDLIHTNPPPEHDKKQKWARLKWERMDEEEQALWRDRNIYVPGYIKKKLILEFLNFKYDAGKKLEILDKAFEYDKNKISERIYFDVTYHQPPQTLNNTETHLV